MGTPSPIRRFIIAGCGRRSGEADDGNMPQSGQTDHAAHTLRRNRRDSDARDAPVERRHEENIQRDIAKRGRNHRVKRRAAVAQ